MAHRRLLLVSKDRDSAEFYAEWFARTTQIDTTWIASVRDAPTAPAVDVVLLDVTSLGQWDDCAALTEGRRDVPVVALSGWVAADGRFRQRAFAAGCAAFVAKPCHPRVLVAIVHRVLRGERQVSVV